MNVNPTERQPKYRPSFCLYHANPKGTGSAVKLSLIPAEDGIDGCVMLKIACQLTIGDRSGPRPTYPTFDWENSIGVKLGFGDLTQMLQVFRGECEAVNGGKGLYHSSAKGTTGIRLSHLLEPVSGYVLDVTRRTKQENDDGLRARFMFSNAEALGICEAIAGSMHLVCFGVPFAAAPTAGDRARKTKGAADEAAVG